MSAIFNGYYRLYVCAVAPAVTLRTILRDNETFSAHLTDDLSLPTSLVRSLMSARVAPAPVSITPLKITLGQLVTFSVHEGIQML